MINQTVQERASRFVAFWEPHLGQTACLRLDYSWPSVAVLDLITHPLRLVRDRTPFDHFLLEGAAAYLGVMAHRAWTVLGAEPIVGIEPELGVVIRASRGPRLSESAAVVLYIEQELGILLEELPNIMPVIGRFTRPLGDTSHYLSSFAIGLFTGLSPALEGPWLKEDFESFAPELGRVIRHLATTTAESYGRIFPDEPIGQVAELYLNRQIFPVTLLDEDAPLRGSIRGLIECFEEFGVTREKALAAATNLSRFADDRISATGLTYVAALGDSPLSPSIRATAFSCGKQLGLFRRALLDVLEHHGLGGDWLESKELTPADERRITREIELGYWPWLRMRPRKVKELVTNSDIRAMLIAMSRWEHKDAVSAADRIIERNPSDIEVRLQRIYLALINRELDEGLAALRRLATEPEAETEPIVYRMIGISELGRGDLASAELNIRKGKKLVGDDARLRLELHCDHGFLLQMRGDYYGALAEFDDALAIQPDHVLLLLNRFRTLCALNQLEGAETVRNRLLELAPADRDVFCELIFAMAVNGFTAA